MSIHHSPAAENNIDTKTSDPDQHIEASHPQPDHDAAYENKEIDLARHEALIEGEQKFHQLGWKKLTICLIVKAIALGALSIPSAFANLGMIAGVILTVGIGLIAIYTSNVIGQVAVKYPHVKHYADAVRLIWGRPGYELCGAMFVCYLTLLVGSHTLSGTIAFVKIVDDTSLCALVWAVISAIILFLLALPPSFAEFAILGYIDFVSIIAAIMITVIATGVEASRQPGGLSAVEWSAWPPEDISLKSAFLSTTNIVLAYSFAVSQFSFMAEMHTPKDYIKSIWSLGLVSHLNRLTKEHQLIPLSPPDGNPNLHPNRRPPLRLRRPLRPLPRPALLNPNNLPHSLRRRPPRNLHLRQHQQHSRRPLRPDPRLPWGLPDQIRKHPRRLVRLDNPHSGDYGCEFCCGGGGAVFQRVAGVD
jgi:hypothetical protein